MDNWDLAGDPRQVRVVANHLRVSGGVLWIWLGVDET